MPTALFQPDPPPPPGPDDVERWRRADIVARPRRLARLRERLVGEHVDAYLGLSRENSRYLTGFVLDDGEEKVAGDSGRFIVSGDEVVVLADTRYREQAEEECPDARIEESYYDLPARWGRLVGSLGAVGDGGTRGHPGGRSGSGSVRRVAVEASYASHALWTALRAAAPGIELVAADGWVEEQRAVKEPSEIERVRAACGVADAALTRLVGDIRIGTTERELALRLEWDMRTHGAEALAFDVACLSGPRAALPHGSPGERRIGSGEVLLFDFGAQVAGYRSDMTRTLLVGEPNARDMALHALVAAAQEDVFAELARASITGVVPGARSLDGVARKVIDVAGHGPHFGHGLGHGIGLATHELPRLSSRGPDDPLPAPSVFSVEPGVYLPGETGVRIEDLVAFDPATRRSERLTRFTREVTVVGE